MNKKSAQLTVNWKKITKQVKAGNDLIDFHNKMRKAFGTLPEHFILSFKDSEGRTIELTNNEDYNKARNSVNPVIKVIETTISEVVEVEKANLTNKHSVAVLDEKNCSYLEIINEGNSVEFSEGHIEIEEDKEPMTIMNVPMRPCISCDGYKKYENGEMCKECGGLGEMNLYMYNYFQKIIEEAKHNKDSNLDEKKICDLKNQIKIQKSKISQLESELQKSRTELRAVLSKLAQKVRKKSTCAQLYLQRKIIKMFQVSFKYSEWEHRLYVSVLSRNDCM